MSNEVAEVKEQSISAEQLYADIMHTLMVSTDLVDAEIVQEKSTITINWNYQNNSKFDIHDGQVAVSQLVYKYANLRPTWFSGTENLSIIRVI